MILYWCVKMKMEDWAPSPHCKTQCPRLFCLGCCGKRTFPIIPNPPSQQLRLMYNGLALTSDVQRRCSVTRIDLASLQVLLWQGRLSLARTAFSLPVYPTFISGPTSFGLKDAIFYDLLVGHILDECHSEPSISHKCCQTFRGQS